MLEGCPSLKDLPAWVALAVRPVSGCPSHACELIGTVRLCILPGQDDVKWKGLEATYQTLLPWALPAFKDKVVVFDENLAGSDLLPWDKSHRCHFLDLPESPGDPGLSVIQAWAAAASQARRLPHRPTRGGTPPPWRP